MGFLNLIPGIASTVAGFIDSGKKNKQNKEQLALQRETFEEQKKYSEHLKQISDQILAQKGGFKDVYGGGVQYDPETGEASASLGPVREGIQGASDNEELARLTLDQAIRRGGLQDAEANRQQDNVDLASARARSRNFDAGIGKVDAGQIGSQLGLDRTAAVNAGFDEAARNASVLGQRTGNAAIGDSLSRLARERAAAIAQTRGSPNIEGLSIAENINRGRRTDMMQEQALFSDLANNFKDVGYTPAPYADMATAGILDQQRLDLDRKGVAMGGNASAAANIGSAAAGMRGAYQAYNNNRVDNRFGKAIDSLAAMIPTGG